MLIVSLVLLLCTFTNDFLLVNNLTFQEVTLYSHLIDILIFFMRQPEIKTRNLIHEESLAPRIAQLLRVPQKHLKLSELPVPFLALQIANSFEPLSQSP